jgi:hypothetical protein
MTKMSDPLTAFRSYRETVNQIFDKVDEFLVSGDVDRAAEALTVMTQVHARTAVSMRAIHTKNRDAI